MTRPNVSALTLTIHRSLCCCRCCCCFFCSTFGIVQLAKFEGGVLKTSGDIASTSHEFYRSVFLGEGGEDEKVNK